MKLLIDLARSGDKEALEKLIEIFKYIPIKAIEKSKKANGPVDEDLEAEELKKLLAKERKAVIKFINEQESYAIAHYISGYFNHYNILATKRQHSCPVEKLTNAAKMGDIDAYQKLLERNFDVIQNYAEQTYDRLKQIYIEMYELTDEYDQDVIVDCPNNIIDKEDIIQDFMLKSNLILNNYLIRNINYKFNAYLHKLLKFYQTSYINQVIFKLEKNSSRLYDIDIDYSFLDFIEKLENKEMFRLFYENLNDRNKEIIYMLNGQCSVMEIAQQLGITTQRVYQIIDSMACKLKKLMEPQKKKSKVWVYKKTEN